MLLLPTIGEQTDNDGDNEPPPLIPRSMIPGDDSDDGDSGDEDDDFEPVATTIDHEDDVRTIGSGPFVLSEGAFELFESTSLINNVVDEPTSNDQFSLTLVPTTLKSARTVNGKKLRMSLKALIDHGASHSIVNKRCLPKGSLLHYY